MTMSKMIKFGAFALALSTVAIAAMPAQAAGPSFSIQFGNSDFNNYPGMHHWHDHDHSHFQWDRDSIQWKLSQDYRDVSYQRTWHGDYVFTGRQHHTWYQLIVDSSNGHVWAKPIDQNHNGGFDLHLNF